MQLKLYQQQHKKLQYNIREIFRSLHTIMRIQRNSGSIMTYEQSSTCHLKNALRHHQFIEEKLGHPRLPCFISKITTCMQTKLESMYGIQLHFLMQLSQFLDMQAICHKLLCHKINPINMQGVRMHARFSSPCKVPTTCKTANYQLIYLIVLLTLINQSNLSFRNN